jgi:hypothetical protein
MDGKKSTRKPKKQASKKPVKQKPKRERHTKEIKPKKKPRGNRRPTSRAMLDAAAKQARALELRKAGYSFDSIAARLGYANGGGAYKAVEAGLKATLQEPADELRQLEIERLDTMLVALWPKVKKGEHGAIDRALKVSERRASLIGLDAPTRIDSRIDVTKLSDAELDAYIASQSGARGT